MSPLAVLRRPLWLPASRYAVRDRFAKPDSASSMGTAETGQVWTPGNSGDAATLPTGGISGQKGYFPAAGNQVDPHIWVESGLADCIIEVFLSVATAAQNSLQGFLFRRVDASNYFLLRLSNNADTISVFRNLATVRTNASGNQAITLADGQTIALTLVLSGSSIKAYSDGALVVNYTDANLLGGTKHGLYAGSVDSARWADFRVRAN